MKTKQILAGAAATLFLFSLPFASADGQPELTDNQAAVVKEFTTETSDFAEQFDSEFEKTITNDGKTFELKEIQYEVTEKVPYQHVEEINDLYTQEADAADTITVRRNGEAVTLSLKNIEYVDQTITGRTTEVTATTNYNLQIARPTPDSTKTVSFTDEDTSEVLEYTLPFTSLEQTTSWAWRDGLSVPITFRVYDSEFYNLAGTMIPYSDGVPALTGHEELVLSQLELSSDSYVIDSFTWSAEAYDTDGIQYRDATATGRIYNASFVAHYGDTVELPDAAGYTAKVTYEANPDDDNGVAEYTVEATAIYELPEGGMNVALVVGLSLGALVVIVGVIVLIAVMSKRKKAGDVR